MEQIFSKIKLRILEHIDLKGINKRQFYIKTGISNGVLDKKTGLNESSIEKYLNAFPEINPTWLLTGKGNMFNNENEILEDSGFKNHSDNIDLEKDFAFHLINALVTDDKVKKALQLIIGKEINSFISEKLLSLLEDPEFATLLKNKIKSNLNH